MSRILFLGTAGDSAVVTKQLRASGGFILQVEDLQFHINPGPGALNKAREFGVNLNHNTAILITQNHINRCNDLNAVIDCMTHAGIEHRGVILGSKSALQKTEHSEPYITKRHAARVEKIIALEENHKVGIELVEINALPAENDEDETAIGLKFFCPKFTLSYTGDTKLTPALLESLNGSDVLILDVPYPGNKAQGSHLDRDSAIKIISHVRPKLAILTGFGLEMLKADPLQETREVQRITGVQTLAAKDGLLISPSYGQYQNPIKGYE